MAGIVLSVCNRVLGDGPDAEDAFQATFVVLSRKATAIRKRDSLPSWLYGVAFRLANRLKIQQARRHRREKVVDGGLDRFAEKRRCDPVTRASLRELAAAVDEELQRLPENCRTAIVACHMQGLSHTEAAEQLGWPLGTLKARVQRGRELLTERFQRRGIALSGLALTVLLTGHAKASVPATLMRATLQAVLQKTLSAQVSRPVLWHADHIDR